MRRPISTWRAFVAGLVVFAASVPAASAGQLFWSAAVPLDPGVRLSGVACPSSSQCTAVTADGHEVTFDPTAPSAPVPVLIDSSSQVSAVACPSTDRCIAVDWGGQVVIFDPAAPAAAVPVGIDSNGFLRSVVCPSVSLCVGVDAGSAEVAFNPASPSSASRAVIDAAGWSVEGVACPTANECVGVDLFGGAMTWNPSAPGFPLRYLIDPGGPFLNGVACLSATACTAVDNAGHTLTFNPFLPALVAIVPLDPGQSFKAVTCLSSECVLVDGSGRVFAGNPANPRSWTLHELAGASALTAVSCPSLAECVTVDSGGNAYVGLSAPVTASPPSIAGPVALGRTLTELHGTWLGSPAGYSYQWQRCDSGGLTCAPIAGATTQTYTVTEADGGSTLRVQETATNAIGTSGAATSTPTVPVTAPSSGGGGGSPPSSPPPPGTKPPVITQFRITNDGTVFKYTLSGAASVRIAISVRLHGRRHDHSCLAPTRRLRHAKSCTRTIARRTLSRTSHEGANVISVRPLKPGHYRATITATGSDGQTSVPKTVTFTAAP